MKKISRIQVISFISAVGLVAFTNGTPMKYPMKVKQLKTFTEVSSQTPTFDKYFKRSQEHTAVDFNNLQSLASFDKNLDDTQDVQLYSTLYFGSQKQEMTVIYDTGSPWLWVQGSQNFWWCSNSTNIFQTNQSSTYELLQENENDYAYFSYGSGYVYGYKSSDQVCITEDQCIDDFIFGSAYYCGGLETLSADGILGLGSSKLYEEDYDLFVDKAYDEGLIDQRVFSFQIGAGEDDSFFTLGGYDEDLYATEDIQWHNIVDESYWWLNLTEFTLGDQQMKMKANKVIIDTGTSYLYIPSFDYKQLFGLLYQNYDCDEDMYAGAYCNCTNGETYPDFKFKIDDVEYVMTPYNYFELYEGKCYLRIMSGLFDYTSDFWILGLNFFHNYYSVFDMDNKRIGFALSASSDQLQDLTPVAQSVEAVQSFAEIPVVIENQNNGSSNMTIVALILTLAIAFGIFAFVKKSGKKMAFGFYRREMEQRLINA